MKNLPLTVLTEKPSDEVLRKLDDLSHSFETLELLGASLKPEDYLNMGNDLFYKNDYESAIKAFNKAIKLNPDYAEVWDNKGTSLCKLGRHDEALKAHDKAIELKHDLPNAWFNRACNYSLLGNKEKAISDLEKAIELRKSYKEDAKTDIDFKDLWDDKRFKKLVE